VSSIILTLLLLYKGFTDLKFYSAIVGSIWFIQFQELYRSILFANIDMGKVLLNDCITYGCRLLFLFLVIWFGFTDLYIFFAILGFSSLLGLIIGYFQTRVPSLISLDRDRLRIDFNFGKWLLLDSFLAVCSYGGYVLLVSKFVDDLRFGTFAASDTVVKVLNVFVIGVFAIATPIGAKKFAEGHDDFLHFMKNIRVYGTALILITCSIIFAAKDAIFHSLYADKFTNYSTILLFLMAANLAFFYQFTYVTMAKVYEKTRIIFFARVLSAIFSISVGVIVAIQYSAEGIAFTIALSNFVAVLFLGKSLDKIVAKEKVRALGKNQF